LQSGTTGVSLGEKRSIHIFFATENGRKALKTLVSAQLTSSKVVKPKQKTKQKNNEYGGQFTLY